MADQQISEDRIASVRQEVIRGERDEHERRVIGLGGGHLPCGGCGGPHQFDTSVPSVLWNETIRSLGLSEYLCTTCIVREFVHAGRSFTAELYGDGFHGVPIEIRVRSVEAEAAAKIQDENNLLRSRLHELEAALARTAGGGREQEQEADHTRGAGSCSARESPATASTKRDHWSPGKAGGEARGRG